MKRIITTIALSTVFATTALADDMNLRHLGKALGYRTAYIDVGDDTIRVTWAKNNPTQQRVTSNRIGFSPTRELMDLQTRAVEFATGCKITFQQWDGLMMLSHTDCNRRG